MNSLRSRAESATSRLAKQFGWAAGQANAFRHGYWMAMIGKRYGVGFAVGLGKAHEADTPRRHRRDSEADLHNNPIGARYGDAHDDWSDTRFANGLAAIISRRGGGYDYGD